MIKHDDVITILARRGHGKTTLSKKLQEAFPRVIVIDRLQEYEEKENAKVRIVRSFAEFAQAVTELQNAKKFRIIYQFDVDHGVDHVEFNEALRVAYHLGNVLIVVEEVHNFATPHNMPRYFREVLLTGRHQGLALISTTQRPGELHKTLLSQSSHIFAGSIHETNDVRYLSNFLNDDAARLKDLKRGEFLHFRPGEATVKTKIF